MVRYLNVCSCNCCGMLTLSSESRYVFGVTHIPRLEDWPVMPVEHIGFSLMVSMSVVFKPCTMHCNSKTLLIELFLKNLRYTCSIHLKQWYNMVALF